MNLVNKDDLVDAIESTDWYHVNSDGKLVSGANSDEDVALYKEADIYKAIESVEPVDAIPFKWIPCSERLPEEVGTYLVTVNFHGHIYVCMDNFLPSGWEEIGWTRLAWAKVPEPYKGETE